MPWPLSISPEWWSGRAHTWTCSTEAEIRRHCAFEAPEEINSGDYRRISLAVSTISHT
jgi:hypothetical protein